MISIQLSFGGQVYSGWGDGGGADGAGSIGNVVKLDSIIFEVDNHSQFLMVGLSLEQIN